MKRIPGSLGALWRNKNAESKCKASGIIYLLEKSEQDFLLAKLFTNAYKEQDGYDFNICVQAKAGLEMIGKISLNSEGYIKLYGIQFSIKIWLNTHFKEDSKNPNWLIFPENYIRDYTQERLSEEQVYIRGRGWVWPECAED